MKRQFVFLTLLLAITVAKAQNLPDYLIKNAVPIEKTDSVKKDILRLLNDYSLIMIGEIHGTNEPVNFVETLVDLFTKNGDSVQVGFEIPSKQMTPFLKQPIKGNILKTEFFAFPSGDGRASLAWYKAIANICKNPKASLFFFDINDGNNKNYDSVMYLNIKSRIKKHPNHRTITICGNIHNSILPINGQMKTGNYLLDDKEMNLKDSICSLNLEFKEGETLWNEFKPIETAYTKVDYNNYLCLFPKNSNESYHGVFFTRYLTKSESAVSK